ncbi:hypothetical protein MHYP_G00204350 [Metynnis hypsauchen]
MDNQLSHNLRKRRERSSSKARARARFLGRGWNSGHWESLECRWERKGISTVSIVRSLPPEGLVCVCMCLISGSEWNRSDPVRAASLHVQNPPHEKNPEEGEFPGHNQTS